MEDEQWAKESNLARILGWTGAVHSLALICVGLRMYARLRILRTPGRDDAAIVVASLLALGGYICFIVEAFHGLGRHSKVIPKADLVIFEKASFCQSIISAIGALGMLKISIAFFLLRLSKNKWYSRSLWALIVFVILYSIEAWGTFFFHCSPMAGHWDKSLGASCYPIQLFMSFAIVNTSFNIGTDVLFATLPIPIVWSLQMSRRTRVYIIGILSLGYLAVAMGIIKVYYQFTTTKAPDRTFKMHVQFWGFIQLNVGIIAATIPTLKPLLKKSGLVSSGDRYNQFDANDHRAGTIGSGMKTPRSRRLYSNSMTEGADQLGYEMRKDFQTSKHGASTHVYATRSGSEDTILDQNVVESRGIKRTTEVVVGEAR